MSDHMAIRGSEAGIVGDRRKVTSGPQALSCRVSGAALGLQTAGDARLVATRHGLTAAGKAYNGPIVTFDRAGLRGAE